MRLLQRLYEARGVLCGPKGVTSSTQQLMRQALALSRQLPPASSSSEAIAFVAHRDADYLRNQWAIWLSNRMAVPLSTSSALSERHHIIKDSGASHVISHPSMDTSNLSVPSFTFRDVTHEASEEDLLTRLKQPALTENAMLLYTSGTTGVPKGVLATQSSLFAQVNDVATTWELSPADHVLHFLPLHHAHGIVNNMLSPLLGGATVDCLEKASPAEIWLSDPANPVTVLMAVPSIYMMLLESFEKMDAKAQANAKAGLAHLRVAISGSMACPVSILQRWQALTGGKMLLERYGMTECGMALGNPLHGERHLGFVGQPFPSIEARTAPETSELQLRGATLFKEYWKRPIDTKEAWTDDGWFKTGDIAAYDEQRKSYKILGRASVDIIKSAGYKISALEIEQVLLDHPQIRECAVYGAEDETWGQIVTAVLRVDPDVKNLEPSLEVFLQNKLAKYKKPRQIHIVEEIPKNAMGKINKKQLAKLFATTK
ncbi:hypothetical protein Ae201684P_014560 [Aphanomyces euteiches]|nr:hypothetical protein Ae201684P_014560 [Aphanomyces euteiches]